MLLAILAVVAEWTGTLAQNQKAISSLQTQVQFLLQT